MKLLFIFAILFVVSDGALFSWLFEKKEEDKPMASAQPGVKNEKKVPSSQTETDVALATKIPFETSLSDEKFLMEAAKYTSLQLSELDVCHHKVVLGLQTTCNDLTEEELAKVAVNLLNCQSVVEGRPIFPCTSAMTLAKCTKNMDPNTWNAYHIVSNRARAVCYASRQEQFRAKTELTVNKLMDSAEQQIRSMSELQATSETFNSLSAGHDYLQKQQQQLSSAQQSVQKYVASNLRELHKEKMMIAGGQGELALITGSIKKKLDEARAQLSSQEESQRDIHNQILLDLAVIQENALEVWKKLDASTSNILNTHEQTIEQYSRLTQKLNEMNATVHDLMAVLYSTRGIVEDKLSWISQLLGGTDDTVQKVYSCVLHAGYFLISMLAASFLQVPYLTRVVLVVLVPLNALSEIKTDSSLEFSTLTTLLAICVLVNLSLSLIVNMYRQHRNQTSIRREADKFLKYKIPETLSHSTIDVMNNSSRNESVNNRSFMSNGKSVGDESDEYSSDEEQVHTPLTKSAGLTFLRKRSLDSRVCSQTKNEGLLSTLLSSSHKTENPLQERDVSFSSERVNSLDKVRRHLLDHLDNPKISRPSTTTSLHNRSLRSTPLRETPSSSRSGTPSRSTTPKKLCIASCKNGQICRNSASLNSSYCHRHDGVDLQSNA